MQEFLAFLPPVSPPHSVPTFPGRTSRCDLQFDGAFVQNVDRGRVFNLINFFRQFRPTPDRNKSNFVSGSFDSESSKFLRIIKFASIAVISNLNKNPTKRVPDIGSSRSGSSTHPIFAAFTNMFIGPAEKENYLNLFRSFRSVSSSRQRQTPQILR